MMNRVYPNDRTEFVVCFAERARNPLRSDGRQGMINDILLFVCSCACVCPLLTFQVYFCYLPFVGVVVIAAALRDVTVAVVGYYTYSAIVDYLGILY